ncbi:TPA: hypothetical protein DCW54_03305 [Candidatus Dependentiae bacterium]|nr:hypothetical protein [Candidatus Dependentiae bacterium]
MAGKIVRWLVVVGISLGGLQLCAEEVSPEVTSVDQLQDMVSQTQEQFVLRKQASQEDLRKALVRALVSAYIAGVFSDDCSVASMKKAVTERNWRFMARVVLGASLSVEETLIALRALRDLYRIHHAEREFERVLRDFFASIEMQQGFQEQLDAVASEPAVEPL